MTSLFMFSYDLATAGWSTATISDGVHTLTLTASYLSDALGDLTQAVIALLQGAEGATLAWQAEPGVIEWRFERQGDDVVVCLTRFADNTCYRRSHARPGEPDFSVRCSLTRLGNEVLDELWRIHDTVGVDGYKERWKGHSFPLQEYRQLHALLRERSRRHGTHGNTDAHP